MTSDQAAILSANELKLAYGWQTLLEGVTLGVAAGEKVGLVGRNGCGKTSLLKILAGEMQADAGDIYRQRGLRVGYLPQEFELDGAKTVRENIEAGAADLLGWLRLYETGQHPDAENDPAQPARNLGLAEMADLQHRIEAADGWNLQTRIKAQASALSAPPLDALVGPLSGGEKRRVALCRALAAQPDLLLLDEPTNHLDAESIRWLEEFLREFPGAVIFVTHDRYFLDVIATRILELADGRCYSHPGNYTAYLESKAIRQQIAEQAERRRQRFLRVELEWVRAGVRAQRSKARHRLDVFYAVEGLEAPPEERELDLIIPPAPDIGNKVVELVNAGARVGEGEDARWLFRNLNLTVKPGECTGIVGRNGVGKTTLLRLCLGERQPEEGTVTIGKKVAFNYIDQNRVQLNGANTVFQEVAEGNERVNFGTQTLSARAYLRRFLFPEERINERVDRLSGGERARLMLAKVLRRGGNAIVLDEPTNDLDLPSLRILEEGLADFDGSVIVVSHDRYFLDRICDQILAFEDGGVVVEAGNYSRYLEQKQMREQRDRATLQAYKQAEKQAEPAKAKAARPRKLTFKEQRELEGMEAAILEAEGRAQALEATLNDPAFYATRAAEAPKIIADLENAKAEVAKLYDRWHELDQVGKA